MDFIFKKHINSTKSSLIYQLPMKSAQRHRKAQLRQHLPCFEPVEKAASGWLLLPEQEDNEDHQKEAEAMTKEDRLLERNVESS